MDDINALHVLSRWLHVVAAITAIGGAVFMRFVLMPSARRLPDDAHETLRAGVRPRYARLFLVSLIVLLLTGFYNYLAVERPTHVGQPLYDALIGVKILLALAVFFIGSALIGRAAAFEAMRRKGGFWLAVNVVLALVIVALAGVARALPSAGG